MRRTLAVLALSGLLATVVGSASHVDVDGSVIQYGEDTVSCDTDGVNANWGLETRDATTGLDYVRTVRIDAIDANCAGAQMFVQVLGSSANLLFEGNKPITTAVSGVSFTFTTDLDPEDIESLRVWIEG